MTEQPAIGGKFMMSISLRIAERLRDTADKLKLYAQLTQAMQQEIDRLMPT
jgi:CRP/FNR family transcriptional regulator, cyclic AMP receptor protein